MPTKSIKVTLQRIASTFSDSAYRLTKLVNAARVSVSTGASRNKFFRVGDSVSYEEADALSAERGYEVTILDGGTH